MQNLSVCRMCLASEVRLCSIAIHLRDMYERITSLTFQREDNRPLLVCYICHARLRNCYRLKTSCLQSEELLNEMMSSGVLKPQDVLSTNTFRMVSALHLYLGHTQQDNTECHIKAEALEVLGDAEIDQLYTEDNMTEAQKEQCAQIDDYNQWSHLYDPLKNVETDIVTEAQEEQCAQILYDSHLDEPLDVIKREADDLIDDEDIKVETEDTILEENDHNSAGPSSQYEDIKLEIEHRILEKNDLNSTGPSTQSMDNICSKVVKIMLQKIDVNDKSTGARVSKNIAAPKDTEAGTTIKRKIEVKKNKETENITIKEPKVDTKKKQFSCNTCEKGFNCKINLKTHILTHTGEKPYGCKKKFIKKNDINNHILTHTGERPYQCKVCKKRFTRKNRLNEHIRIHTGEKPFQCTICKKCFNRKDNLKFHILTHTVFVKRDFLKKVI